MNDYYYLLASLPDLELGRDTYKLEFEEVYQAILENLQESDEVNFRYLLYPQDNKNLIQSIARKTGKQPPFYKFFEPAVFSREEIEAYEKNFDAFPEYMSRYVEDQGDQLAGQSLSETEKKLQEYFYAEALELPDDFLAKYFGFERDLQNILLALNSRKHELNTREQLIGEHYMVNNLKKSSSTDFGLSQDYTFIESLNQTVEQTDPEQLELQIDRIRWEYLDELTRFSFFNTHKVFAYTVKLFSLKRWISLDPEAGQNRLDEIVNRMMEDFKLPSL